MIPKKVFFVKGKGYHQSKLASFEEALRDAGIERYNLVEVSSIFPPYCIEIDKKNGLKQLRAGEIVYTVMSRVSSNEDNQVLGASIGVAEPKEKGKYGYLSEYHVLGEDPKKVGDFAENLAAEMLATTLGVPFDPEANYDNKEKIFKMNGERVKTKNVTESGTAKKNGGWLTVLAAAIFIL